MAIDYNEKVLAHFCDPHNVGVMTNADGVGHLGDPACGDVFVMFIRVRDGRLADIKYLVRGCGAAIATCSALSDIALGKTIEEALQLTDDDISLELGGAAIGEASLFQPGGYRAPPGRQGLLQTQKGPL